ncbi:MAG: hypothetical protein CBC42_00795 [Betaproteobacteria bacterium TMED82]|nr:MAG: hypothetical protein CBC42_00795 [Betaproteobacteria bacterium TMED82]
MVDKIADTILANRATLLFLLAVFTIFCLFSVKQINTNPGFEKTLPAAHPYIETFYEYREVFGSANRLVVSYKPSNGTIYNEKSLKTLKKLTDEIFYFEGVERSSVTSLFTTNVRYIEVVEDGFRGGNIISANFSGTEEQIKEIRKNVIKSNWNGRIVSKDGTQALVLASLQNKELDVKRVSEDLEKIRNKYEINGDEIYILGFSKAVGDVIKAAKSVLAFFVLAFLVITVFTRIYTRSWAITSYVSFSSLIPVVWLLGLMPYFGLGLDPLSVLVPFLIFAIAVSHAVQMTNAWKLEVLSGGKSKRAAKQAFVELFLPGSVALLANAVGFFVIALVDIKAVRELAFTATIGVSLMVVSNKLFLPILLSYCPANIKFSESLNSSKYFEFLWDKLSYIFRDKYTYILLLFFSLLFISGSFIMKDVQIGELSSGVSELKSDSRYNLDRREIVEAYDFAIDNFKVIAEIKGEESPCLNPEVMKTLERFEFFIFQNPNVMAVEGMAGIVKKINQAYSEDFIKWRTVPSNSIQIAQGVGYATRLGNTYMNTECSALPVSIFLHDRKAKTIESVISDISKFKSTMTTDKLNIRLALGNVGVSASRNEVIESSEPLVNLALFSSVGFLCLCMFRSLLISLAIMIPLLLVTIWCNALMVFLNIGVKMNTLPVIALGVAVGVDYSIYLFERMYHYMKNEKLSLSSSYLESLRQRGSASIFTALVTSFAVFMWYFSELKFQQDMGLLLGFMFVFNLIVAIILVPLLLKFFNIRRSL